MLVNNESQHSQQESKEEDASATSDEVIDYKETSEESVEAFLNPTDV